ncbi:MAG: hypothetical protein V1652_00215, partial [bacterium]
ETTDNLLKHKNLLYILYRWKEWDKEEKWKEFIKEVTDDDAKLLLFTAKFVSETKSQTIGDYGGKITKKFNYKSINDFIDLEEMKKKLEEIRKQDNELYKSNKESTDLFLDNFGKKHKGDLD